MSQNGFSFDFDEPWLSDSFELSIETLTGTTFEIRVAPDDTIMSIKAKIQRVEGIPISQQHLLYNLVELDNSSAVKDYSLSNGAVLKLVLSMRGGPISSRRLPPADDALWREVQEWMTDVRREDSEQGVSSAKTSIVVFRDGNSVNLFRVVENDDGTYSPVSQSASSPALKDLLSKEDPLGFGKRMMENWVTMGKMQELKGKLEKTSGKKEKSVEGDLESSLQSLHIDEKPRNSTRPTCSDGYLRFRESAGENSLGDASSSKSRNIFAVNEGASCSGLSSPLREGALQPARAKARKDAENIIRLQSKSLSVVVDGLGSLKRAPLPEIRRSPRPDRLIEENTFEEKNEVRGKTGNRMPTPTFAILEEESDVGPPTGMCSSAASSLVALSSNDDVNVAYTPMSRDHNMSSVGSKSFRLSRYIVGNAERPKTAPTRVEDKREIPECDETDDDGEKMMNPVMCSTVDLSPSWYTAKRGLESGPSTKSRLLKELGIVTGRPTVPPPPPPAPSVPAPSTLSSPAPLPKLKPRCMVCKKRLNITNTHTCRCDGVFCSVHRYSETHDCHFNYKEEGKNLLRLSNPVVTAPKLPKI